MLKKFALIPLLLIITVIFAGCISNKSDNTKSEFIPVDNLPVGFTYMGSHETTIDVGGVSLKALEGIYRQNNVNDVYIQVNETDKPDQILNQYMEQTKQQFKSATFEDISINDHNATKITHIPTIKEQRPSYTIIWTTKNAMILVTSSTADLQAVIALATATKH